MHFEALLSSGAERFITSVSESLRWYAQNCVPMDVALVSTITCSLHPEPPSRALPGAAPVCQGVPVVSPVGGQQGPDVLVQSLPNAEPSNFAQHEATSPRGLPQHLFLKDIKSCQGT